MRLPASRTLRRRPRPLHPVFWRAPRDGTVRLRNPAPCDPVRERGDRVFRERPHATTGLSDDTTAAEYFFPNDNYFPDVDNLFINDMAAPENNISNSIGSSSSAPAPYVLFLHLLEIMLQFLLLEISMNMLFSSSLLVCVTSVFCLSIIMIYLLLSWIK